MVKPVNCDLCGKAIAPHTHYVVKMEVFADPEMPAMTSHEIAEMDLDEVMKTLMEDMKGMSTEELLDQVHRAFEFRICRGCQVKFLANPLGKPRETKAGKN